MRLLVLGATGLLGHTVFQTLMKSKDIDVIGTLRSEDQKSAFDISIQSQLIGGIDVANQSILTEVFDKVRPDQVINCIGYTKHQPASSMLYMALNSVLPHRLLELSNQFNSRLIHISTDCVFSGERGNYQESDIPDADDLYGKSKILGEIFDSNSITLRTSIIGHELLTNYSLLNWFLAQHDSCEGYRNAIFSGLPTVVFAEIIRDLVIPNAHLSGLYHVSASPINKFDLLTLIAKIYQKKILIKANDEIKIDRSLNSKKFKDVTGFSPPPWENLINYMHSSYQMNA
jgi:dTDP-4-dehydrorhamnose reductase